MPTRAWLKLKASPNECLHFFLPLFIESRLHRRAGGEKGVRRGGLDINAFLHQLNPYDYTTNKYNLDLFYLLNLIHRALVSEVAQK